MEKENAQDSSIDKNEDSGMAKINAALHAAQSKVVAMYKDAENGHHRYTYTKSESLIDEGRRLLNEQGLILSLVGSEIRAVEIDEPGARAKEVREIPRVRQAVLRVCFSLRHKDVGTNGLVYQRDWPAVDERGRPIDKAVGGAHTTALAYAIRDLLLIPRDDDKADMSARDDTRYGGGEVEKKASKEEAPRAYLKVLYDAAGTPDYKIPDGLTSEELDMVEAMMAIRVAVVAGDPQGVATIVSAKRAAHQGKALLLGPFNDLAAKAWTKSKEVQEKKTKEQEKKTKEQEELMSGGKK